MPVTIKDVAKEAGVSISTVSKVINNSYTISEETAKKVREVMERLHYHPNLTARNFVKGSTGNVIFLANLEKNSAFANPHMFEIICGAQKSLEKKGYSLQVLNTPTNEAQIEAVEKIISQRNADGIIIHGCADNRELAPFILKASFPHMVIGYPNFDSQLCWMDTNNCLSGEITATHLIEEGYQEIAFIGGLETDFISVHRLQGVKTALKNFGIPITPSYLKQGADDISKAKKAMEELLKSEKRPDSVICANNLIALGALDVIKQNRLKIPDDIAVITFDDYPFSQITEPKLTVVNIDVYEIGVQAGNMIISKIKKPNLQIQSYSTLPELIIRESTKKTK